MAGSAGYEDEKKLGRMPPWSSVSSSIRHTTSKNMLNLFWEVSVGIHVYLMSVVAFLFWFLTRSIVKGKLRMTSLSMRAINQPNNTKFWKQLHKKPSPPLWIDRKYIECPSAGFSRSAKPLFRFCQTKMWPISFAPYTVSLQRCG